MKKDKIIRYVYGFIFITIVIGLGDMPYVYYQFLRWAVSVSLLFLIFNAHNQSDELTKTEKKEGVIAKYFFGISVILFNPIFPIHLNLALWRITDVVVLSGLIVILYRGKKIKEKKCRTVKLLLMNKILRSIKNGNKAEKVDGLTKLSKILNGGEYEDEIDSVTSNLNLEGANLSNSIFKYIDLSDSNLRNANLEKSVFLKIYMRRVDLENANLKNSTLTFSDVEGANLKNADLEGAYLFGVKFKNTNLLGANLRGANLQSADISDSLIKLSDLDSIEEKKLTPPNFRNATYDCNTKFPKDFNPEKEGMLEVDMYTHKKI